MNGYYPRQQQQQQQYGGEEMQGNPRTMMAFMGSDSVPASGVVPPQSVNDKSIRRRSMPISYGGTQTVDASVRRMTMMDFSVPQQSGVFDGFQFDPSAISAFDTSMSTDMSNQMNNAPRARRASQADLSINTQMPNQGMYGQMGQARSAYASPMNINESLDMDLNSPYVTSGLPMNMDFNMMSNDMSGVDMFGAQNFDSPMNADFTGPMMGPTQDPGGGGMVDSSKGSLPASTENSVTPDFRASTSRTGSHEGSVQPSARGTSTSAGTQPSQIPSIPTQMASQIAPALSTSSFPQAPPSTSGPQMIGGTILPWSTPAGKLLVLCSDCSMEVWRNVDCRANAH